MQKIVLLLLIVLASNLCFGQQKHPQNKQEMIAVCTKFMDAFRSGKYDDAFQELKSYTVIEDYKIDTLLKTVKGQMTTISTVYGKTLSYEEVSEKDVKNSLVKLVYLVKFEKFYIKFFFILYNNGNYWAVTNVKYTEDITDLF